MPDDLPDHICPGCGADVTGFMSYEAHYTGPEFQLNSTSIAKRTARGIQWPWVGQIAGDATAPICPWTRDYLAARWLERHPQPWSYQ